MRSATKKRVGKDPKRLAWMLTLACWVTGRRPVTVHHVRFCGSLRDDGITLPLIAELHMLTNEKLGVPCIERGKRIFEQFHGVSIDEGVRKYQELWEKEKQEWQ